VDALCQAIQQGDAEAVRRLVAAAPELLRQTRADGSTPVLFAAYIGQRGALDALLATGHRLSAFEAAALGALPALEAAVRETPGAVAAFSADGWTALHLACFFGRDACAQWLLAQGSPVNATSRNAVGNRPLHSAAAGRHRAASALLLAHGAEPDAQQHGGYTALHSAAMHGDEALVEALLAHGATPGLRDEAGKDAAQYAEEKGHPALAQRLRAARPPPPGR
jgi:uncharacterized protein